MRQLTFAILFLLSSNAIADDQVAASNTLASEILQSMLPIDCAFSANFTQSQVIQDIPKPITSNGALLFSCQHGLVWRTQTPTLQILLYGSKGKVNTKHAKIDADGKLEYLSGRSTRQMAALLNAIMGSDTAYILKRFDITQSEQSTVSKRIHLTPKNKHLKKFITHIELDKQAEIVVIRIINNDTESITINLNNITNYDALNTEICHMALSQEKAICELFISGLLPKKSSKKTINTTTNIAQ